MFVEVLLNTISWGSGGKSKLNLFGITHFEALLMIVRKVDHRFRFVIPFCFEVYN